MKIIYFLILFISVGIFPQMAICGGIGSIVRWKNFGVEMKVRQVAVGYDHICAILEDSNLKCWGGNGSGQLGSGNTNTPGDSPGKMSDNLSAVNLGTGRKAIQVAAGDNFTCAILDNASVKCWGWGGTGRTGQGNTSTIGDGAGEMGDSLPTVDLGTGRKAVQLATGYSHVCVILDNGSVKCWGSGTSGKLGQGNTSTLGDGAGEMGDSLPTVNLGTGRTALQIRAGMVSTCALLDNGSVKCWGSGIHGLLGQGNTTTLGDGGGEMGDSLPAVNLGTGRTALQISVGDSHSCALLDNSTVKCWGDGTHGALGSENTNKLGDGAGEMGDSLPVVNLGTGRSALQIMASSEYTCALLDNSKIKCWGGNTFGELGLGHGNVIGDGAGEMGDSLATVDVGTGRSILQLPTSNTGGVNTCAILDDSSIKCWGTNLNGQLGQGHTDQLGDGAGEMGDNLAAIKLGKSKSRLQKIKTNFIPGLPRYKNFPMVSVGKDHSCAILVNGSVKCWGLNLSGELGLGHTNSLGYQAGEMGDHLNTVNLGTGRTALQIAVGTNHTCALLDNSTVKCWGGNASGQLGLGHTNNLGDGPGEMGDSLSAVNLGTGRSAIQIVAATGTTCAILDNASVKCWGVNSSGQLGLGHTNSLGDGGGEMGDSLPAIDLGTGRKALSIASSVGSTCAILDNSTVKCWGVNFNGKLGQGHSNNLGDGAGEMGDSLPAISLGTGRFATQVAVGDYHVCAILDNSTVKCWGYNAQGQLGQGHTNSLGDGGGEMGDSLAAIDLGTGRFAIQVSIGKAHSCALLDNASVKCWGLGNRGQLGQGATASLGDGGSEMGDSLPAIDIGSGHFVSQISMGYDISCVVQDDSLLKCWGYDAEGQLGQENSVNIGDGAGEMGNNLKITHLGTTK